MVGWCVILIALGIFGVLQDAGVFTKLGYPYRMSTWIIMLIALGILVRTQNKQKIGEKEHMKKRIEELEKKLGESQK